MKINVSGEKLFASNYESTKKAPKVFSGVSCPEVDTGSVKVTISEEGKRACKNNLQNVEKTDYESMVANRAEVIAQKNTPEIHYGFMLGNKLMEITEHEKASSIEEKGMALVEAYARAYDEIVQGYADGTRCIYVEDTNTESGYRKMTMEEEIAGLDVAYQKYVSGFEAKMNQAVDVSRAFDKYMATLSKLDVQRAEMAKKAKEIFDKADEEAVPENITGCMLEAKQKFISLYWQQDSRELDWRKLFENIKIFS